MKKVSIKEVAKLAGVSPTTVSRVINNSDHPVSEDTKKMVENAIEELNFTPNRMAQGLLSNKSNIIGVIVHDISDDYFSEILKGIESVLYEEDYIVNIFNTYRDIKRELRAVNMLGVNRADAVIFTGGSLIDEVYNKSIVPLIKQLKADGSVILSVTRHPYTDINFEIGNSDAAKEMTNYLFKMGHKKIAYVNGPRILSTSHQRCKGFIEAFNEKNITINYDFIFSSDFTFEGGRKAALKIIKIINDISAVLLANDEMALGLIWELRNQGFSVPEDISVVGIGNIPSTKFSYPPLTTLSLPMFSTGAAIGSYILKVLKDKEGDMISYNSSRELVERESVLKLK